MTVRGSAKTQLCETDRVAGRAAALWEVDPQFRSSAPLPEVIEKACAPGQRLTQIFKALVDGYAERPALGQRARRSAPDTGAGHISTDLEPRWDTISYRQLWDRVGAIATAWRHGPVHSLSAGGMVAVLGFASADYLAVDMTCAYLGLVAVPLQHNAPVSRLRAIVEECEPKIIAASSECLHLAVQSALTSPSLRELMVFDYRPEVDGQRENLERARARLQQSDAQVVVTTIEEVIERGNRLPVEPAYTAGTDQRLAMILYTSGSTGAPKGCMYTEEMVAKLWTAGSYVPPGLPVFNVNFMPLNHLGGRLAVASAFLAGGTSYFVPESDLSTLFEDWALVRPTELDVVPRVAEMLFHHYRSAVDRRIAEGVEPTRAETDAAAELREETLGGRVLGGVCGSAPLTGEISRFLDDTLGVHIADAYGLTETGPITKDGMINPKRVIDYKLVDVPELGYFRADQPCPRGELLIKTDMTTSGYYKRPEVTAEVFDEDGFYRTGDVMAEVEPGRLRYVDRRNNVLKLAQGEFVAMANLEAVYAGAPLVRQIYLYGNSERSSLLAVVVPIREALAEWRDGSALKAAVIESLRQAAAAAQLQSHEVPVDVVIETEPFSDNNGLLSGIGKLLRPQLKERYGERLEQMYIEIAAAQVNEMRALREAAADRPVPETLIRATVAVLGTTGFDVGPDAYFTDLGGDSLSALTFSNLLGDIFGVDVPVGVIISPANTIGKLADYIETQCSTGSQRLTSTIVHGRGATEISASDLTLDKFIDAQTLLTATTLPHATGTVQTVLLTGANGWLGRFLMLEWLERLSLSGGRLIAIVRGRDEKEARARLGTAFDSGDFVLLNRFRELAARHLEVLPGDIDDRDLGLDAASWKRLADSVDLIVHSAALVNHVLPYDQLFGPNVVGTAELIRLALSTRIKPVIYLSTVAVAMSVPAAQFDEDGDIRQVSPTRPINDDYANGYANSKWAGEVLLREANDHCGLPVAVFRSDLILAHTRYSGQLNVPDVFSRLILSLLMTGIAPRSFYQSDGTGGRAMAHYGGLPVDFIAEAITTIGAGVGVGYRSFDVVNPHDDGVSLDVFVDWLIQAGNNIHRIDDYHEWLTRFQTALKALPEWRRQHSILPLLHAFGKPEQPVRGAVVPTKAFHAEVRNAKVGPSNDIPHVTPALIQKYVSDLQHLGLLD